MKTRQLHHLLLCALLCLPLCGLAAAPQPYPIDTVNGTAVYKYTPEKSIGLYRISVRFGVSQDVIIQWNPQLQERGPQLGETLLIPVKQSKKEAAAKERRAKEQQPMPQVQDTAGLLRINPEPKNTTAVPDKEEPKEEVREDAAAENMQPADSISADSIPAADDYIQAQGNTLRIGLMLPLRADAAERDANDDRFFDFYAGVLLAVKRAEAEGQAIEMHVYDTDKGFGKIDRSLADSFLHKADAIIGPVYPAQAEYMSETVLRDSVLMVVPFADNIQSTYSNPFILQFNPTPAIEAEKMADYITRRENETNCIVVDAKEEQIPQSILLLHKALEAKNARISRISLREILNDSIDIALKDTMENILIFNTEKYGNLQVLMPHVTGAGQGHVLTLLSHYSWQKEKIPMSQIYTSIFSTDSIDGLTAAYEREWGHYFGYEHITSYPRYDLLGYDIANQVISMLQQLQDIADPVYREVVMTKTYYGLQSDIQYKRASETGGYINHGIRIETR